MGTPRLKAIGPNDRPPEAKPLKALTILQAIERQDYLQELIATHKRLAVAVQDEACPPAALNALTKQQLAISKEISQLRKQAKEEAADNAVSEDENWSEEAI